MKIGLNLGEIVARKYSDVKDDELNSYYNSKSLDFLDINTHNSNLIALDLFTRGLKDFNFEDNKILKKYFHVNVCLALKACIKDVSDSITFIKKNKSDDKIIKLMEKTKKKFESSYMSKKKQVDVSSKSNIFDDKMFEFAILILDNNYKILKTKDCIIGMINHHGKIRFAHGESILTEDDIALVFSKLSSRYKCLEASRIHTTGKEKK